MYKFTLHSFVYRIFICFIIIPFIYPEGFSVFSNTYKTFFNVWLFLSCVFILGYCFYSVLRFGFLKNNIIFLILLYSFVMLITTIMQLGNIYQGYRKIFTTPLLITFLIFYLERDNIKYLIETLSYIVVVELFLNCFVFSPKLLTSLYGSQAFHIMFIGHVQVGAQVSILGLLLAIFAFHLRHQLLSITLIVLSIINMFYSQTSTSYIILALLPVLFIVSNIKFFKKQLSLLYSKASFMILLSIVMDIIIVSLVLKYKIVLSGRYFVWQDIMGLLKDHYLFGYGVYGVDIHTFWMEWTTNQNGMNYAHNEIFQQLLDGGITLLCIFYLFVYSLLKNIFSRSNALDLWVGNLFLLFLLIGFVESLTEYNYFYIFIVLVSYSYEIKNNFKSTLSDVVV